MNPALSPDGREVAFTSERSGVVALYGKRLGGGDEEVLFESKEFPTAQQSLKDGSILFNSGSIRNFYLLPLPGKRTPVLLFATNFRKTSPRVSSERWISYQSNESGRWEVYVAMFPTFEEKRQVSNNGGCQPRWRKDGKELFYLSLERKLMSVPLNSAARLETTVPKPVFQTILCVNPLEKKYWVTGNGNRFIFLEPLEDSTKPFTVVLNWTAGLRH